MPPCLRHINGWGTLHCRFSAQVVGSVDQTVPAVPAPHLVDVVAAEVQADQGGVARPGEHGVAQRAHGVGRQVQVRGVQGDGDGHGGGRAQPTAVHPGQAEAVELAKVLHLAAAPGVAVLDCAGVPRHQQEQDVAQQAQHRALGGGGDGF